MSYSDPFWRPRGVLRKTLLWRPTENSEPTKAGFYGVFEGTESRQKPALAKPAGFGQKRLILPKVGAGLIRGGPKGLRGRFLDVF